mgnify:CR=1 FL=1
MMHHDSHLIALIHVFQSLHCPTHGMHSTKCAKPQDLVEWASFPPCSRPLLAFPHGKADKPHSCSVSLLEWCYTSSSPQKYSRPLSTRPKWLQTEIMVRNVTLSGTTHSSFIWSTNLKTISAMPWWVVTSQHVASRCLVIKKITNESSKINRL